MRSKSSKPLPLDSDSSLTEVTLPSELTEIGARAFIGCESLNELMIPDSVKKLGNSPFLAAMLLPTFICRRDLTKSEIMPLKNVPPLPK